MHASQAEIIQQSQQQYIILGVVDFNTAPDLARRASVFLSAKNQSGNKIKVDLSKITECNSAGLALLFEIAKYAQAKDIQLKFENLPGTLLTIAKAYGAEAEVRSISE